MFETLTAAPPDPILGLTEAFQKDENPRKINLTVGVFKDANGTTPLLKCVKEAEKRLLETESTKSYLGIDGLAEYDQRARHLLFGDAVEGRAVTLQTPGGTGALRVAADLLHQRFPATRIWCSKPTWANHPKVFAAAGLDVADYRYLHADQRSLDFAGMLDSLSETRRGDAICLHACCHNPTGVDPTPEQWDQIADLCVERGTLPLIDCAYQGFGSGLEEDTYALRAFAKRQCELLVCSSYSKNFSLYSERVGALTIVTASEEAAPIALSHAKVAVRSNYSNPPKHGAAIVATILADDQLRTLWEEELAEMRNRIHDMRRLFVEKMREYAPDHDFSFIAQQKGMFSFSGLSPMQVDRLKSEYSIYAVGSGRINVAGVSADNVDYLCQAIASTL